MNSAFIDRMQEMQQTPKPWKPVFAGRQGEWVTIAGQRFYSRSKWESNYSRYLAWMEANGKIKNWEHEPETFWFEGIRRGVTNYKPDFKVTNLDGSIIWIEVKGFMCRKSKLKLKRMRIYHPTTKIVIAGSAWFRKHGKTLAAKIPGWEKS